MIEYFKKGQIVPRRLRLVKVSDKKAQHSWVFGADVKVSGRTVYILSEGYAFYLTRPAARRMNNGTYRKSPTTIRDIRVVPYPLSTAAHEETNHDNQ